MPIKLPSVIFLVNPQGRLPAMRKTHRQTLMLQVLKAQKLQILKVLKAQMLRMQRAQKLQTPNQQQPRFIFLAERGPRVSNIQTTTSRVLTITGLLLALTVSGCAQKQWHTYRTLPKLIQEEGIAPDPGQDDFTTASTEGQTGPRSKELEPVPPVRHKVTDGGAAGGLVLPDKELLLNADNLPFTRFIDLALGESLELNYEIAPELANRTDPITLHVSKPVSADQLFGMIQSTLLLYKVGLIASNSGTVQVVLA